ncbi:DNA primase [Micromonospora zhanjiangensis]|uniref:DNA primase n=1 Tax=Micromonospora zhanjiangensis TaxID=1522057 RepID=A0ABV8KLA1_9ACTN
MDVTADDSDPVDDATESATAGSTDDTADRSLWEKVRIDPVEIALPAGSGFTLRAYRMSNELTPTDISDRDPDDPFSRRQPVLAEDAETVVILDEDLAEQFAAEDTEREVGSGRKRRRDDEATDDEAIDAGTEVDDEATDDEADEEEADVEEEPAPEEVPVFLSHRGKLLLFKTPGSLVEFVRSDAPNDLRQLDTWGELVERIRPADVAPLDEDSYELDLVVENLRGGHDTWDSTLLIRAGEVARDLAYALRLPAVLDMLSSGSSLDDLDEALRAAEGGGIGGFMGRRRLKKIGAQTASLGWRTIIGKISAAADWRD